LLFQTGVFEAEATALAGGVLAAYGIAVPAQACIKLYATGHYALGDTRTPVRIAMLSVVVSAGSAYALMQHFGPAGIALGAGAGAYLNLSLNFWTLSRRLGRILDRAHHAAVAGSLLASLPAAAAGMGVAAALDGRPVWAVGALAVGAFALVYAIAVLALGHPEARRMVRRPR